MTMRLDRRAFSIGALSLGLTGCAGATVEELRDPVPEPLLSQAALPGYKNIRYWGDDAASIDPAVLQEIAAQQARGLKSNRRYFLSISGGGSSGAYGAGLLFGWSAAGTRPEFTIVTGISTGSLTAPFAFLGHPYDDELRSAYTEIEGSDIFVRRSLFGIIGSDSAADNSPLRKLVSNYVTEKMMAGLVREHARGRRLLIGTTNIDAERPVIWDIGAIASSGQPGSEKLIEDILVASASIPGVFPPVRLNVVADGQRFDELHVDGGTSNQAFLFPSNFSTRDADLESGFKRERTLFVIRNGKVTPEYSQVKPRLTAIVAKSVSSLIKNQGIGDLYRMYALAQRDNIAFNATWVPESFTMKETTPFEPKFMRALFDLGYEEGRSGINWKQQPP